MGQIAREITRYGTDRLFSLIVAKGNATQYVKEAMKSDSDFVMYMMAHLDEFRFEACEFHSNGTSQPLRVSVI